MTHEELQQIRAIVYDAYCEGDTEAWWMLVVIDAALAAPEPQPDTWDGAEEWERLAFELCADEHGEESCNELIWSDFEPWGERWLKYEDEAKRMISLVRKHTAPVAAPQQPVSMETVYDTIIEWSTAGKGSRRELARRMIALFAAPQREWQDLTKDEINDCAGAEIYPSSWAMAFARAIESKLKEKNHG